MAESQALVAPPRLPYHPAIQERYGIDKSGWKALVEAIFPNAQSTDSVVLALAYCHQRNLDVFKRCIHIVPIWDKKRRCLVETVWPGIAELRITAFRTGRYAGRDATVFGPMETGTWKGENGSFTVTFPTWAQITVYRNTEAGRAPFPGARVYWLETFGTQKGGAPSSMWEKRPSGQLEKCAEAAALRAAFPEEIGGDLIDDEVGHSWHGRPAAVPQVEGESRTEALAAKLGQPDDATAAQQEGSTEVAAADGKPAFAQAAEEASELLPSETKPKPPRKPRKKPEPESQVDPAVEKTDGVDDPVEPKASEQQMLEDDYVMKTVDATSLAALDSLAKALAADKVLRPNPTHRVKLEIEKRRLQLSGGPQKGA